MRGGRAERKHAGVDTARRHELVAAPVGLADMLGTDTVSTGAVQPDACGRADQPSIAAYERRHARTAAFAGDERVQVAVRKQPAECEAFGYASAAAFESHRLDRGMGDERFAHGTRRAELQVSLHREFAARLQHDRSRLQITRQRCLHIGPDVARGIEPEEPDPDEGAVPHHSGEQRYEHRAALVDTADGRALHTHAPPDHTDDQNGDFEQP